MTLTPDDGSTSPLSEEQRRAAEAEIERVANEVAAGTGSYRRLLYLLIAVGGIGGGGTLAAVNAPEKVRAWVGGLFGAQQPDQGGKIDTKQLIAQSRVDADQLLKTLIQDEKRLELRTVTEAEVRAGIEGILADKKVSSAEVWDLLARRQETELLAIARRYNVVAPAKIAIDQAKGDARKTPDADRLAGEVASPAALRKRLPLLAAAGDQLAVQLKRDAEGPMGAKWKRCVAAIEGNDEKAAEAAVVELHDSIKERLPYSADVVVLIAEGGGHPVGPKGKRRLVSYEHSWLQKIATDRFELLGQAETYRGFIGGVQKLGALHGQITKDMQDSQIPTKDPEGQKAAVDARLARIEAASATLAKTTGILELRTLGINDPPRAGADADKAVADYFREKGQPLPANSNEAAAIIREDRTKAMQRLQEELNYENVECVEAGVILRDMGQNVQAHGDPAATERALRDWLERNKGSKDARVAKAHAVLQGLADKRPVELKDVQAAYLELAKDHEIPLGDLVVDRLVEWANEHKKAFRDADALKSQATLDRYKQSRNKCARQIIVAMDLLLRIRTDRARSESGIAAATVGFDTQGKGDDVFVQDPRMLGNLEAEERRLAHVEFAQVEKFLSTLDNEHKLNKKDLSREAALAAVRVIRRFLHVIETITLREGQNAPDNLGLKEVVDSFDPTPLRNLLQRYEALVAAMDTDAGGKDAGLAADRRWVEQQPNGKAEVERLRKQYREQEWTPEAVQRLLQGKSTPAERLALRLALEDRRADAMRPFLNEEMANLLRLAAYSDQMMGVVGNMERGKDGWLPWILFIAGCALALGGARYGVPGLLRVSAERRNARRIARGAGRASMAAILALREPDRATALRSVVEAGPASLLPQLEALAREAEEIDLTDMGRSQKKLKGLQSRVEQLVNGVIIRQSDAERLKVRMPLTDQVRTRLRTRPMVQAIHRHVHEAVEEVDGRGTKVAGNANYAALTGTRGQLQTLNTTLQSFETDLPPTTPNLAETDPATAPLPALLLVAEAHDLDIDAPEDVLRRELGRIKSAPPAAEA